MHTKHKCTEMDREGGKTKREGERGKKERKELREGKRKITMKREKHGLLPATLCEHLTERTTTDKEDNERQREQKGRRQTVSTRTSRKDDERQRSQPQCLRKPSAQHSVSHSLCLCLSSHSHSLCLSSLSVALNFVWRCPSFLSRRSLGMVLSVPLSSSFSLSSSLSLLHSSRR